jgi:hypothetical protein
MPFPAWDFLSLACLFVGLWLITPRDERVLRIGAAIYLGAVAVAFLVATPVGGNISRLGEILGAPLALCALWPRRRWLAVAAVVPLVLFQWSPAFASFTRDRADPSAQRTYFQPLLAFLSANQTPAGRVEVVPTRMHWESAFVAPAVPLARGWERQLDTAYNPLFYDRDALTASRYREWLLDNGVRYVALADVPLDYAAVAEGRLVAAGVGGLSAPRQVGRWRVYSVVGSHGLVSGPGEVTRLDGGQVTVHADQSASLLVRIRYDRRWAVLGGGACIGPALGPWTTLNVFRPGDVRLQLRLVANDDSLCPSAP